MKFLCDRCKTRYSIGDDRVRGKILKIRCKNCANVITVREGMTEADEIVHERRGRPTTMAPAALVTTTPASGGALAAAFAAQVIKPPPALEEEWYVSIDGDQFGPFSLADAQRWIAAKGSEADLHCWSEGFDDWLPVDKVSHFRGLRKKAATTPPPTPRAPPPKEDEPKPLFAATMASLEKSSGAPAPERGLAAKAAVNGTAAKSNGAGSAPVSKAKDTAAKPSAGAAMTPAAKALAAAFDTGVPPPADPSESMTMVDAPRPFGGESEPAKRAHEPASASAGPMFPEVPDDGSFEIGEVSRVVKLADLAKMGAPARKVSRAPMRGTGSNPRLDPAAINAPGTPTPALAAEQAAENELAAAPVVAEAHRRGLIMLIGVAAVLLIGVAIAVVLIVQNSNDGETGGGLGHAREIDTSRPEEVVRAHMNDPEPVGSAVGPKTHRIITSQNTHVPTTGSAAPEDTSGDPKGTKLKAEEIEDMAHKQETSTGRCYMRAQRGVEGIELGDLKKLSVTIAVDKTGTVTDVQFSEHGTESLGICLGNAIKRWRFRESPGGNFRFVLAFAN